MSEQRTPAPPMPAWLATFRGALFCGLLCGGWYVIGKTPTVTGDARYDAVVAFTAIVSLLCIGLLFYVSYNDGRTAARIKNEREASKTAFTVTADTSDAMTKLGELPAAAEAATARLDELHEAGSREYAAPC